MYRLCLIRPMVIRLNEWGKTATRPKNVRYKPYESPNKDPPKVPTGGGELVSEVDREGNVINDGDSRHLLTLNDEVKV